MIFFPQEKLQKSLQARSLGGEGAHGDGEWCDGIHHQAGGFSWRFPRSGRGWEILCDKILENEESESC